jgi:hypothetical protein
VNALSGCVGEAARWDLIFLAPGLLIISKSIRCVFKACRSELFLRG